MFDAQSNPVPIISGQQAHQATAVSPDESIYPESSPARKYLDILMPGYPGLRNSVESSRKYSKITWKNALKGMAQDRG